MSWSRRHLPVFARSVRDRRTPRLRRPRAGAVAGIALLALLPGCLTPDPGLGGAPPVTWVVLHEADRPSVTWIDRDGVAWMRSLDRGSGLCRRVAMGADETIAFFDEADSIVRAPAALGDEEPAAGDSTVASAPIVNGDFFLVRADGSVLDAEAIPSALRPALERLRDDARSFGARGSDTIVEPPPGATIVEWSPADAPSIAVLRARTAVATDA